MSVPVVSLLILGMAVCLGTQESDIRSRRAIDLIEDPRFGTGFKVYDPKPGKLVERGRYQIDPSLGEPVWGLAQWSSKYFLVEAASENLPSGSIRFANRAKSLIVGTSGSEHTDLVLGIDSREEYVGRARKKGEPWPHLLVQQKFGDKCPRLPELQSLQFEVSARLNHAERFETPDYTPSLHAAQFLIFFTVQNRNRNSPGFGDFLWLGVPIYDDRGRTKKSVIEGDVGLGKLIYTPARSVYTDKPPTLGKWITFKADLLPIAVEALQEAWNRGFLKDSQDLSDYGLGGMNMGWELPGINKVEMQVRGLGLRSSTAE